MKYDREQIIRKIEISKTKYFGIGLEKVSNEILIKLYEDFPNWDALSQAEKEHFYKKSVAAITLEEFIAAEYGGDDKDLVASLTKIYADAIEYVRMYRNVIIKNKK